MPKCLKPALLPPLLLCACSKKAAPPVLLEVSNDVRWQDPDGLTHRASVGLLLPEGGRLTTHYPEGKAAVGFSDKSRVDLGPGTVFEVRRHDGDGTELLLSLGLLKAEVQKLASRRFVVHTPSAVCSVRGTRFRVAVDKAGRSTVDLFSGALALEDRRGKRKAVDSGQRFISEIDKGIIGDEPMPIPPEVTEYPLVPEDLIRKAVREGRKAGKLEIPKEPLDLPDPAQEPGKDPD